jgi:hypothetical protein
MINRIPLLYLALCSMFWTHQSCGKGTFKNAESPQASLVKEAIYYALSPESGLKHKQASDAVYWIVRTTCDESPGQTPEIASNAIHAISRSAERTVLTRMAASNETSAEKARQLYASVSATVTITFNDYVKKAVKAVFDSRGLDHRNKQMLQEVVDAVTLRFVRDLSLQAALSDHLMRNGTWMGSTSLPVANGMNAADLTRDVCRMMGEQALASGFDEAFVVSVFSVAQSKCFEYARIDAQRHYESRVGSSAIGLASKVASLKSGAESIRLYHPCPVVTALEQLRNRNSLANMRALRGVIRSSLAGGR